MLNLRLTLTRLKRCGKSCRLRWLNYLRPNIKHGSFTEEEDNIILNLYISIGSRWSIIAAQLPGRTDNDIKNYWNTRLKKKFLGRRKQQQHQHLNDSKDEPPTLSSSALERLQLHMQLHSQRQFQHNSFSFFLFNNPALLPKLHPLLQEKLMHSDLHNLNHQIHHPCNNPVNLLQYNNNNNNNDNNNNKYNMENSSLNGSTSSEISNVVNNNDDANNNNMMRNNLIFDGCNSGGLARVPSFQAELDQLLGNEFERMSGWWSHDSNSSLNASNVNVHSENELYQDYGN